jgi:hypothetical protein
MSIARRQAQRRGMYLAQIGRIPLFTRDGEIEFAKRTDLGDGLAQKGEEGLH